MDIIVTGSIAYDYLMRFPGRFKEHLLPEQLHQVSVSFLVDDMTKHWGGVAANIAYSMALLGLSPKLMGTVGRDFPEYRQWLESVGVDTSTVRQIDEVFTASFFCNTDLDNNQIASFYAGAMAYAKDYPLAQAYDGKPEIVVISPNDPVAMMRLAEESRQREIPFVYDPSQQVARLSGDELARDMQGAYAMITNGYEFEMISQKTGKSLDDLRAELDVLIVTHGPDGSTVYDNRRTPNTRGVNADGVRHVAAFPADEIKDPTGGGDAFRAGFIYGMAMGWPLDVSAQVGSLCATYAIEHIGPQTHHYRVSSFIERYRHIYDDEGILDSLLPTET